VVHEKAWEWRLGTGQVRGFHSRRCRECGQRWRLPVGGSVWTIPACHAYISGVAPATAGFDPVYGMVEYACHEGNYALRNILSASRAAEAHGVLCRG
jgi:hypothetical protein